MSDAELDGFKRNIDLPQYAASQGYAVDKRDSWRGSTVMRNGADKIVIKKNGNGHDPAFRFQEGRKNRLGRSTETMLGREGVRPLWARKARQRRL